MSIFRYKEYIMMAFMAVLLHSCFTGIESTPRITSSDVRRQHITTPVEHDFLSDVAYQPISKWQPGKHFYVTDPKISMVLIGDADFDVSTLVGHDIVFRGVAPLASYTGEEEAVIDFVVADTGMPLSYKTQVPYHQLLEREYFDIPFAIDRDIVAQVADKIQGAHYFITTPLWYDASGSYAVQGLRHVEVVIDSVMPGNSVFPVRVLFHDVDKGRQSSVFMSIGSRRTSTRNFDTIFAFDNPRKKYTQISDDDWALITHSRVRLGMSRDECRLALGVPTTQGQRPTTAGMVEYWSYSDGTYLLFEDGVLASFRR